MELPNWHDLLEARLLTGRYGARNPSASWAAASGIHEAQEHDGSGRDPGSFDDDGFDDAGFDDGGDSGDC